MECWGSPELKEAPLQFIVNYMKVKLIEARFGSVNISPYHAISSYPCRPKHFLELRNNPKYDRDYEELFDELDLNYEKMKTPYHRKSALEDIEFAMDIGYNGETATNYEIKHLVNVLKNYRDFGYYNSLDKGQLSKEEGKFFHLWYSMGPKTENDSYLDTFLKYRPQFKQTYSVFNCDLNVGDLKKIDQTLLVMPKRLIDDDIARNRLTDLIVGIESCLQFRIQCVTDLGHLQQIIRLIRTYQLAISVYHQFTFTYDALMSKVRAELRRIEKGKKEIRRVREEVEKKVDRRKKKAEVIIVKAGKKVIEVDKIEEESSTESEESSTESEEEEEAEAEAEENEDGEEAEEAEEAEENEDEEEDGEEDEEEDGEGNNYYEDHQDEQQRKQEEDKDSDIDVIDDL